MDSPSERVPQEVAQRANTDPLELPPLYFAIDPDALDAAIEGIEEGKVEFRYAGHRVAVHSDGAVSVIDEPASEKRSTEPPTDD